MDNKNTIIVLVSCLVIVLAQLIIAPNMVILNAVPNFILSFVVLLAIVRPRQSSLIIAFVLGLCFDFLGYGPVGAMSLLLSIAAYAVMRIFKVIDIDTFVMPLVVYIVAVIAIEFVYSIVMLVFGVAPNFADALIYRMLPSILIDCIVGLIFYPILYKLLISGFSGQKTSSQDGFKSAPRMSRKSKRYR